MENDKNIIENNGGINSNTKNVVNNNLRYIEDLTPYERQKLFEKKSKNYPTTMQGPYGNRDKWKRR